MASQCQKEVFFIIPHDDKKKMLFYNYARRADLNKRDFMAENYKKYRICSDHFLESDFLYKQNSSVKYLKPTAVPVGRKCMTATTPPPSSAPTATTTSSSSGAPKKLVLLLASSSPSNYLNFTTSSASNSTLSKY